MAATKGRDFGAALSGLVLGGSMIFLVMLLVVWLTNTSFANKEGHGAPAPAAAGASATGATAAPAPAGGAPAR